MNTRAKEWMAEEWRSHDIRTQVASATLERVNRGALGIRCVAEAAIIASGDEHQFSAHVMEGMWQAVLSIASSIEAEMEELRLRATESG